MSDDIPKDATDLFLSGNGIPDLDAWADEHGKPGGNRSPSGLIYADTIQTRPITFLDGTYRFPLGTVTMFAGDGGLGKSLLMAREAAIVSRNGDGVIFLSAEDDPATVWVPRLRAQQADISRVAILRVQRRYEDLAWDESPTIPGELPRLRIAIQEMNAKLSPNQVRLVVIDPLEAHLDDGRDDGNSSVARRRALSPLDALAGDHDLSATVIHHISKDASQRARYRVLGTSANRNAVRSLLFFAANPDEEVGEGEEGSERIEFHEKHNLSPRNPARRYRIETVDVDGVAVPRLEYLGETTIDIERLMGAPGTEEERTERDEAGDYLAEKLSDSAQPIIELMREAKKHGFSEITTKRAKRDRGYRSRAVRDTNGKVTHWEWYDPAKDAPGDQEDQGVIPLIPWQGADIEPGDHPPEADPRIHADSRPEDQGTPSGTGDLLAALMDCPRCGPREPAKIAAGFAWCHCGERIRWQTP